MIKKINSDLIDRQSFNWRYNREETKRVYPPVVWEFGNKYIQLNYFDIVEEENFIFNGTFKDALEMSLNFYLSDSLNIVELSNILHLCLKYNYAYEEIFIFDKLNIKGKKNFEILKLIIAFPDELKKYIAEKNVSIKILSVYVKLKDNLKNIIHQYVELKKPSVGDFRKIVNLLFDNGRNIDINYYDEKYFKNFVPKNDKIKIEFEREFQNLTKKAESIIIKNSDYFETDTLDICFSINSYDEYLDKIKILEKNSKNIKEIYDLLESYDLH